MRPRVLFLLIFSAEVFSRDDDSNYYGRLGVEKNASTKEIRKAFKKLAYTMHPDKSSDPDAHDKFVEINKIYEVLKDAELRKKYDRWGEKGLEDDFHGNRYESWDFYHQELGLYDEDEEIHVLDHKELVNALASDDIWFIKFYSERCSHCHDLAPSWREAAVQLDGIVKIGAISCRDYRQVCNMLNIGGYPTLMLFAKDARRYLMYQGGKKVRHSKGKYTGTRSTSAIVEYALEHVPLRFKTLSSGVSIDLRLSKPTLYILSDTDGDYSIKEFPDQYRLQTALGDLVDIVKAPCDGSHDWKVMCSRRWTDEGGVFFYAAGENAKQSDGIEVRSFDAMEIIRQVFAQIHLPVIETQAGLKDLSRFPIIVILDGNGFTESEMHTLKILPNYVKSHQSEYQWLSPTTSIRRVDCVAHNAVCADIEAGSNNRVIVFSGRSRYEYEVYHGAIDVRHILEFASDVVTHQLYTITPKNHDELLADGSEWMLDFSAPWCPPCNAFLPDVRIATKALAGKGVKIGYVDCEAHGPLCRQYQIESYPSIKFIGKDPAGNPVDVDFDGDHSWDELVEFYNDVKAPAVVKLTMQSFYQEVVGRADNIVWMVDFAASWCPPCKRMFPEFKKTAKNLKGFIKFGYVECPEMESICSGYNIESYPSIKMFPAKTELNPVPEIRPYTHHRRDHWAFIQFISSEIGNLSPVIDGTQTPNLQNVIDNSFKAGKYVVIDFYANWCNPCKQFAPFFQMTSGMLPTVDFIKVDCALSYGARYCKQYGIQQYPTIQLIRPQRQMVELEIHYDVNDFVAEIEAFLPEDMKASIGHDEL